MTHFCVVVFDNGENIEKLLAPYDENIVMPEYVSHKVGGEEWYRFLEYHLHDTTDTQGKPKEIDKEFPKLSLEELYELKGKEWNGKDWRKNSDGIWENWTTYNPKSKYDYYSETDHRLPAFVPFAFVTPDGEWHTKGKMGWWAMSWDEKPDDVWEKEWQEEKAKYKGKFTILDCHI
jgi:hypothetical protein